MLRKKKPVFCVALAVSTMLWSPRRMVTVLPLPTLPVMSPVW
jgi:hypothetical protein